MMGCFNDDNCFIKQLFEERNRAESEYYRKEQECEELTTKCSQLEQDVKYLTEKYKELVFMYEGLDK